MCEDHKQDQNPGNGNTVNIVNSGNSYVHVESGRAEKAVKKAMESIKNQNHDGNNEDDNESHELLAFVMDEEGTVQSDLSDRVELRNGEIGVFFCLSFLVPTPIRRLPDINLRTGQFARLLCGFDTLEVSCGRRQDRNPIATRRLVPGEFIVVTCNR